MTGFLSRGDQVVAEWTSRATARGGAAYRNRNIGVFTVRDGKITSVREYTDTQQAGRVLFAQHEVPARDSAPGEPVKDMPT